MDRRSWPWKRKSSSSSKNSGALVPVPASANASPANRSSRRHDDHGMSKFLAEQAQEATLRCQEAEEKLRAVNAKLAAAQAELVEKENHVKQHAKVAEEAVTGWERAEEETASVKLQLETLSRRKEELEGKVSHLDSALKDSLRNLQKSKEDHERKMQDVVARKNKECERIRAELEGRVAEVGHRLLESTAESKVLVATLQEKMKNISELTEARSKAEAEIGVLHIRLDNSDKDNMSLQYEIQVLNKQLQIRNDEKDYCKREADAAHKHHQEDMKKIQLLESECQRLRSLVRRKLPGPAAVAQMKQEVDSWGREERRRSFGSSKGGGEYQGRLSGGSKDFQIQLLTERVLSMEEETKLLREVLAQKNNELQAAKTLASSATQELSEAASSCVRGGLKPRALAVGSMSEPSVNDEGGGGSCADAWTSAVISELDKGDAGCEASPRIILAGDAKFQMMDDFAEMEQLTSASKPDDEELDPAPKQGQGTAPDRAAELEKLVTEKEEQLSAANRLCMEISSKLLATEKEFTALQAKNAANESSLIKLQEKLDSLLETSSGAQKVADDEDVGNDESLKKQEIQSALSANVQKVVCLVEALAHAVGVEHDDGHSLPSPTSAASSDVSSSSDQSTTTTAVSPSFEKLTAASTRLVEGKVSVIDFMGELSTVLNFIVSSDSGSEQGRCLRSLMRKENGELLGEYQQKVEKLERESTGLRTEAKKVAEELSRIKVEKELLHQSCERSKSQLQDVESKLSIAERLVSELKQQLSSCRGELSQCRASLEERTKQADATVVELRQKLELAEEKFQLEQDQHQELERRYDELEKQINQGSSCRDGDREYSNGCSVNHNNGDHIAVRLAECQRTIVALGKQLKVLSAEKQQHQEELSDNDDNSMVRNLQASSNNSVGIGDKDDDDFAWSKIKLHGFEPDHLTLPWSPPRGVEDLQPAAGPAASRRANGRAEDADSTWLYSGDHAAAGYRRTVMRSPGRFVTKKSGPAGATNGSNELAKSVSIPLKNHGSSSFSRFFSRNSRNVS